MFAGVERVDLLGGDGIFVLTPFIALVPVLAVAAALTRSKLPVHPPARARVGFWLLYLLCVLALISVFFSVSTRSVPRVALLILLVVGAWSVIYLVREVPRGADALRNGAIAGLVVYAALDVVQWLFYQRYGLGGPAFSGILNMQVTPHGERVVRLAGGSLDPNRAAVAVATYAYIILGDPFVARARARHLTAGVLALSGALVFLTLSRSGLVAFLLVLPGILAAFWRSQTAKQKVATVGALAVSVVALANTSMVRALTSGSLLSSRLSLEEGGSTDVHIGLYGRAAEVLGGSFHRLAVGTGYGSSYHWVQDYFPGSSYGNFHSLYATLVVEAGVMSLVLVLALLIVPALGPRRWLALSTAAFGVFYQGLADPILWLAVAMLWALPDHALVTGAGDAASPRGPEPTGARVQEQTQEVRAHQDQRDRHRVHR